jgi:hypothetical protein
MLVGAVSGPARRLKLCVSAHRLVFFSRREEILLFARQILEAIISLKKSKKILVRLVVRAGGSWAERRGLDERERRERDKKSPQ